MTITKSRVYIVYLGGLWHLIADGRDVATYEQRGPAEATGSVPLAFDGKKVLYRSDTSAPLSVVSDGYNIVQPGEVLDFFSRLIASHGYKMETAGCLYGGKKFWALARTGKTVRINGQDEIAPYLLMATSCDGSMASCAHPTGVRVVCDNTLRMAIGPDAKLARIRVPHSVAFDADAVHAEMGLMEGAWENFLGNIKRMTATKIGRAEAIQIVADELKDEWLDDDGAKMDEASMLESSKLLRRVFALFDGEGLGSEWDGSKGTAWGLMNAGNYILYPTLIFLVDSALRDRPVYIVYRHAMASEENPGNLPEITPKMLVAGVAAYIERLPPDASRYGDEAETVRLIYLAMALAASRPFPAQTDSPPLRPQICPLPPS